MMLDSAPNLAVGTSAPEAGRRHVILFTSDDEVRHSVEEGLGPVLNTDVEVRALRVREAVKALGKMATPDVLVIDVSEEDDPVSALSALADVVEPRVRVLVVGDKSDPDLYRQITRGLGAAEYLYKPITPDLVARYFGQVLNQQRQIRPILHGTFMTVTGCRGGVGASTVASSLAWYIATERHRHTLLLDADLQTGCAALMLGVSTGNGLREALEQPARVDPLFLERAAVPAGERLHVLAAEEELWSSNKCRDDAPEILITALCRRFNLTVADVPLRSATPYAEFIQLAHQRVLVLQPTLQSVREAVRLINQELGPNQARRPVVVLNQATRPGGLSQADIGKALGFAPDVVIPDIPKAIMIANALGKPAVSVSPAFARGIAQLATEISGSSPKTAAPGRRSLRLPFPLPINLPGRKLA